MKISLLNEKITFQKSEVVVDEIGNHVSKYMDYYTCFATISAESPKEESTAGGIYDESRIDFTIRYCKKAMALTSKGYRVVFRDSLYDIEGIDHMNFKKKAIKIHAKRVER